MKATALIVVAMFAVLVAARSIGNGQNTGRQGAPPDPRHLNIVDAGYYVNSVCGSGHKCWVVHVKNTSVVGLKDSNAAATPSSQLTIDFDYYTGTQDAPQQAYRVTAQGTVPPLKPGADVWVRVTPDGHQHSMPVAGGKLTDAPQTGITPSVTDRGRPIRSPGTVAQMKEVSSVIPENARGLTASVSFAKVFQQGQPFTHELTCGPIFGDSIATIKNGQIQIKNNILNSGYQGTCVGMKMSVSVIYFSSAGDQVFAQASQSPETNSATWGQALIPFHFNCDAICQQHCLKPLEGTEGPRCGYRTDLFDGKGDKIKSFTRLDPLWPPKKP